MELFENVYECSQCGAAWVDVWSCTCNDRCPKCGAETEPAVSYDFPSDRERPLPLSR
jgi:predicted  nucleic acid-binding Zn-ribbon protein